MAKIELVNVNKTLRSRQSGLEKSVDRIVRGLFGGNRDEHSSSAAPRSSFSMQDVNLTIPDGLTMVILGPSGCGKSTLLRLIAGLLKPDSGQVLYDGVDLTDIPAKDRRIGMVFQNYALYPQYTAEQNILSYYLFRQKTPELDQEAEEKFRRTSELMGVDIKHLLGRMPPSLSGGERQRIALGRCITRDPVLFLLDEPFSNLDQKLREKYRINLKQLLKHFNITTLYVTHDQHEAMILADEISIMDNGQIMQTGTYQSLYEFPDSQFVAEFLNLDYETCAINLVDGIVFSPAYQGKVIGFRPEDAALSENGEGFISGRIVNITPMPLKRRSVLTVQARHTDFQLYTDQPCQEGDKVTLTLRRFHIFDAKTGKRMATSEEKIV